MTKANNPYLPAIKSAVDFDTKYGWTDDLYRLRYAGGPVRVFVWDDLRDFSCMSEATGMANGVLTSNISNPYYHAETTDKFVPWYSLDEHGSYQGLCLEEVVDLEWLHADSHVFGKPRPMRGKIFDASLELISSLDAYYENTTNFNRVPVSVKTSIHTDRVLQAFTWLNDIDQLMEYNVEKNQYELLPGLDLAPFSVLKPAGAVVTEAYSYS